jgi:hypothetical protein
VCVKERYQTDLFFIHRFPTRVRPFYSMPCRSLSLSLSLLLSLFLSLALSFCARSHFLLRARALCVSLSLSLSHSRSLPLSLTHTHTQHLRNTSHAKATKHSCQGAPTHAEYTNPFLFSFFLFFCLLKNIRVMVQRRRRVLQHI